MATLKERLKPREWFRFANATEIVTAQAKDGFALVYIGDSAPENFDVAHFTFSEGQIIGPISDKASAWARGSAEMVYSGTAP
ncbi:hypothetical protein AAS23_gp82 [Pantoea phage vB_PagS_AAS23]|uniref:Uncharacterized protein n=1 Tax=Pantoea phage vB_PagS_AAS23 TaxID=2499073 RepID=A0A3S9U7V2_9CAUD|nr:hypothetical protein HOU93_gp82 [Pantoea phage vB_PagS_AAS23]AZS06395.1 hypothetical protein AAS23_gp82 [Pantoea phage vB_PagS_AAS23]